jgi:pimeloyl-ACP methyl ester carboxylesterase
MTEFALEPTLTSPSDTATARALPPALDAPRREVSIPGVGKIAYYAGGASGGEAGGQARRRPLLLVHSINAAPSAFEMRPLFQHYAASRPVIAPDLPGFGASERADRVYSPALFADALAGLVRQEIQGELDLVGFSLSAEFAALVAAALPERIRSLVLISPTGFSTRTMPGGETGQRVHRVLRLPGLSQGLFAALTSRPSIRYFLRLSFVGKVPPEMADYAYATAHQPGARYAPLYFLSGQLFTPNATEQVYAPVTQPVLVLHDRDPNLNFDLLPEFVSGRDNWQVERIAPTLGLPHWEKPAETTAAMDSFWARIDRPTAAGESDR